MSFIKSMAVAAVLSVGAVTAAAATESTTALHVRSGPSTNYTVVDTLYSGERVDVQRCQTSGWCLIAHNGPDGWVSARYLTDTGQTSRPTQPERPPRDTRNQPDVNFSFSTNGFGFSIGNGGDLNPRPGRHTGRVCFYEDFNYRGASFCARPGRADRSLGSFNDRISSIRVIGDAQVKVCEDFGFNGRCATLDRSRAQLNGRNNDIISSYRVR